MVRYGVNIDRVLYKGDNIFQYCQKTYVQYRFEFLVLQFDKCVSYGEDGFVGMPSPIFPTAAPYSPNVAPYDPNSTAQFQSPPTSFGSQHYNNAAPSGDQWSGGSAPGPYPEWGQNQGPPPGQQIQPAQTTWGQGQMEQNRGPQPLQYTQQSPSIHQPPSGWDQNQSQYRDEMSVPIAPIAPPAHGHSTFVPQLGQYNGYSAPPHNGMNSPSHNGMTGHGHPSPTPTMYSDAGMALQGPQNDNSGYSPHLFGSAAQQQSSRALQPPETWNMSPQAMEGPPTGNTGYAENLLYMDPMYGGTPQQSSRAMQPQVQAWDTNSPSGNNGGGGQNLLYNDPMYPMPVLIGSGSLPPSPEQQRQMFQQSGQQQGWNEPSAQQPYPDPFQNPPYQPPFSQSQQHHHPQPQVAPQPQHSAPYSSFGPPVAIPSGAPGEHYPSSPGAPSPHHYQQQQGPGAPPSPHPYNSAQSPYGQPYPPQTPAHPYTGTEHRGPHQQGTLNGAIPLIPPSSYNQPENKVQPQVHGNQGPTQPQTSSPQAHGKQGDDGTMDDKTRQSVDASLDSYVNPLENKVPVLIGVDEREEEWKTVK